MRYLLFLLVVLIHHVCASRSRLRSESNAEGSEASLEDLTKIYSSQRLRRQTDDYEVDDADRAGRQDAALYFQNEAHTRGRRQLRQTAAPMSNAPPPSNQQNFQPWQNQQPNYGYNNEYYSYNGNGMQGNNQNPYQQQPGNQYQGMSKAQEEMQKAQEQIQKTQEQIQKQLKDMDSDSSSEESDRAEKKKKNNRNLAIGIGVGVGGAVVLAAAAFLYWFCVYRKKVPLQVRTYKSVFGKKQQNDYQRESDFRKHCCGEDPWKLDKSFVITDFENRLGAGAFCNVYKGKIIGEAPVCKMSTALLAASTFTDCECAVKVLPEFADDIARSDFTQVSSGFEYVEVAS